MRKKLKRYVTNEGELNVFIKVGVLVVMCLISTLIREFAAGFVPYDALLHLRMSQYASSIRVACIILLAYFVYKDKNS